MDVSLQKASKNTVPTGGTTTLTKPFVHFEKKISVHKKSLLMYLEFTLSEYRKDKKFVQTHQNLEETVTDPFREKFNVIQCEERTRLNVRPEK